MSKIKNQIARVKKLMRLIDCMIFFAKRKMKAPVLIDIGARGGMLQPWRSLAALGLIRGFGFEADTVEANLLNSKYSFIKILPFALGDKEKETKFFITRSPDCSSCLMPNFKILDRYPNSHHFQIDRIETTSTNKLEKLVHDGLVPAPTYLKIDAQGYEYNILKGAEHLLIDSVLCIELEAHLLELYLGQKTLSQIKSYLEDFDFILCDFRQQGSFGGEIVEANCFFIKKNNVLDQDQINHIHLWERANNIKTY